jgi:hypothetical protein
MKLPGDVEVRQRTVCSSHGAEFFPPEGNSKVGIALQTLNLTPVNGLRHPPKGNSNGWYIWCGEELSSEPDFFQPLHVEHLLTELPNVLSFLALPPGYRFLLAGEHVDVWFDLKLLKP